MALQQQGMKSIEIAAHMGMAPRTVREWLDREAIPYSHAMRNEPVACGKAVDFLVLYLENRYDGFLSSTLHTVLESS